MIRRRDPYEVDSGGDPRSPFIRGLVLSVGPTVVQLRVVFPFKAGKGYFGLDPVTLTPPFVVFSNAVRGVVAVYRHEFPRR